MRATERWVMSPCVASFALRGTSTHPKTRNTAALGISSLLAEWGLGGHPSIRMDWLNTVRSLFSGGTSSTPFTPAASPSMHRKEDVPAKQVRDTESSGKEPIERM
ncbi:hypothetical protein AAFF_G00323070 [Aldrovandia affinis]|uniref:Uncharacterized protein n=1 Tax=Aldrovandia affinis TaxID=143900 RepID=A0AAD7SMH3_9TELE|nr:hypothetical protein AAFF_G00323070 [Aldrovandia affinis]